MGGLGWGTVGLLRQGCIRYYYFLTHFSTLLQAKDNEKTKFYFGAKSFHPLFSLQEEPTLLSVVFQDS